MNPKIQLVRGTAAILVLGGALACRTTQADTRPDMGVVAKQEAPVGDTPLYARDGTVVQGPGASSEPRHDVGSQNGSRMYLLELYQKTVEEKESLAREAQSLHEAISRAGETQAAIEKERDEARAQTAKLARDLERAQADNVELSARLVTAQIRRLEAEKLLLEARIEALKRDTSAAAGVIETSAPKPGATPKGTTKPVAAESGHGGGHP